ncbi:MAG TPA: hypothetical protein VFE24_17330 [Pirellulales bacterium]|jgi:tetratricopeptide (TPR) repeat protein|nr:hypothetical protein [Pirellulales bacterium]
MSRLRCHLFLVAPAVLLASSWLGSSARAVDPPRMETARLDSFAKPEGDVYFALSLRPPVAEPPMGVHDVAILFDTSASQAGASRAKALDALSEMLGYFSNDDRVCLLAADLNAVPMTDGFVPARGPAMQHAIEKLKQRVPLGATDMAAVLNGAADRLAKESQLPAIVYIGNGSSNGNVPATGDFKLAVETLIRKQIPASSLAIGQNRDAQLLAVLANHTGGNILVDGDKVAAKDAGKFLANSACLPVVWPESVKLSKDVDYYPTAVPPLRFDRDTIVVGKGDVANLRVDMQAIVAGKSAPLHWDVQVNKPTNSLAYLTQVVDASKRDGGFGLPTVGTEGLSELQRVLANGTEALNKIGGQAIGTGNLDQAEQILRESLRRDPGNKDAVALMKELDKARKANKTSGVIKLMAFEQNGDVAPAAAPAAPAPAAPPVPEPPATNPRAAAPATNPPAANPPANGAGSLLKDYLRDNPDAGLLQDEEQRRAIATQLIQAQVRNELEKARVGMAANPAQVQEDLKLLLTRVRLSPDLNVDVRTQLNAQIETMIRETSRRKIEKDARDLDAQRTIAALNGLQQIDDAVFRKQEREKQLMDRFNSLMDEGHATDDLTKFVEAQEVALEARNVDPTGTVSAQAVTFSYFVHDYIRQNQIRDASIRGYMDEMAAVERSHIPFRDDVPIVYPSAQAWRELTEARKQYQAVDVKERGPAEKKILDELDKPSAVEFIDTPLKDVTDFIGQRHGINIQFDDKAMKDGGIGTDTPINVNLKGISLRSILRLVLHPLGLTYVIKDEVLLITTQEAANTMLVTKVYPVADLVLPINNGAGANPFSLGGGLGGQGGFGGGLGGGQANPAGGGFGGGGGGFGGGGFGGGGFGGGGGGAFNLPDLQRLNKAFGNNRGAFNVPDLPKNEGGFRAFAVADDGGHDLKLSSKKPIEPAKPTARPASIPSNTAPSTAGNTAPSTAGNPAPSTAGNPAPSTASNPAPSTAGNPAANTAAHAAPAEPRGQAIVLPAKPGLDPLTAWNDYFGTHDKIHPADLRETVRQLLVHKKFAEIDGLIQAALRTGHGQAWMYEALALSMQMTNPPQPKEEIERALMSAADFASSPSDLMYLAAYMNKLGFSARAFKLYREVATLDPTMPAAYMQALETAKSLNDPEGIKWACTGILSRAWPSKHEDIVKAATYSAGAMIEQLKKENRGGEAAEFQAALEKALSRDCYVKISWNGDADVDLLIEEPSGSVCSSRNPITAAGGTLLGESFVRTAKTPVDGYSESYVCPEGFDGTYKVLLRRVWGKVTAGTVTVDIYTHYRTEGVKHIHQQIPLGDDDKLVLFSLDKGRRMEPVAQQQVANAVANQMALNLAADRFVLAQQLANATDPAAVANLGAARQAAFQAGLFPFGRAGAVGYMPIIITLPEGTNMTATGVVSADRRYVRITAVPLFSSIPSVSTFNFSTGAGTTQNQNSTNGGGGGIGGGIN